MAGDRRRVANPAPDPWQARIDARSIQHAPRDAAEGATGAGTVGASTTHVTKETFPLSSTEMSLLEIPDAVLEAVPEFGTGEEAVVIVDFQGIVLGMNAPAEKLFAMDSGDIAGEFVEMLVPANKRWGHQAYRRGYLAEPRDREMDPGLLPEAETAQGELVPIVGRLQPVRVEGRLFVAAHLTRDDTPRTDPI